MSNKFELIMPTIPKDYLRVKRDLSSFFEYLPIKRIVFIGPAELEQCVNDDKQKNGMGDAIRFINENDLIQYKHLSEVILERIKKEGFNVDSSASRFGWYYQQFLKLAYVDHCDGDYYMSWDSDTIPLKKISMFDDAGKPFLDTKIEYNPGYFRTIKNLFGMEKSCDRSFIAEHMLFDKKLMREMLDEIEAKDYPGEKFYEKIFYAIDIDNMKLGFSEFETFGTWVVNRHPDRYILREWNSMRRTNLFVDSYDITPEDLEWLARDYDAASFESYHPLIPRLANLFHNLEIRKSISAKELYYMTISSGAFGEYVNGAIKDGDLYWAV